VVNRSSPRGGSGDNPAVRQPPPDLDVALLAPALLRYGIAAATTAHAPVRPGTC
jgi:hypothetical protein